MELVATLTSTRTVGVGTTGRLRRPVFRAWVARRAKEAAEIYAGRIRMRELQGSATTTAQPASSGSAPMVEGNGAATDGGFPRGRGRGDGRGAHPTGTSHAPAKLVIVVAAGPWGPTPSPPKLAPPADVFRLGSNGARDIFPMPLLAVPEPLVGGPPLAARRRRRQAAMAKQTNSALSAQNWMHHASGPARPPTMKKRFGDFSEADRSTRKAAAAPTLRHPIRIASPSLLTPRVVRRWRTCWRARLR